MGELDELFPISTHTLRKEGDLHRGYIVPHFKQISTHTLRKEGDRAPAGRR